MSALPKQKWTAESYLAFERSSHTKHEFFNGEIYAMAGASEAHILICTNMVAALRPQLRKNQCRIYMSDMRVAVSALGDYTYPDIAIVCGKPVFEDSGVDTLLNPTVIIEVLSPSTEHYDRGAKFHSYRTLDSLQEYLLISQDSIRLEHYVRQGEQWLFSDTIRLEDVVRLPSIDCTLALSDVYEQVSLEGDEGQKP